ncbi:hypothetical protein ANN_12825 [Periplaneta americana]|uniref:Uncharacterized protein n=1 Tax=Periplaneta americana TaxID=6978 RepID=A0ABQ8TJU5_PERAM|nr:hypothetical protein ANN_12825 [Periplaneta americana]
MAGFCKGDNGPAGSLKAIYTMDMELEDEDVDVECPPSPEGVLHQSVLHHADTVSDNAIVVMIMKTEVESDGGMMEGNGRTQRKTLVLSITNICHSAITEIRTPFRSHSFMDIIEFMAGIDQMGGKFRFIS